jgi:DNA replication protein DnaC
VPYGHALFGLPQRCACLDTALSQARQERLAARAQELTAQLHREMGKLAALELGTLDRNRPLRPITWRGTAYSVNQQRTMLARALSLAEGFVPAGEGCYLYGPNGTGKSHLVAAILNRATQQGIAARYGHAPALLRVLRQGFRDNSADDRLEALAGVTLLAIDDLGAEAPGDWATAVLFDLLKSRDAAGLTTLITSNLPLDALNDPRIVSLIQGNSLVVPLILSDYRALHQGGSAQ